MGSKATKGESVPRSFWFDPRFAIGIALVVLSVAGVLAIVSVADSGVRVYVARSALSPGDRVTPDDLDARSVRLGSAVGQYVNEGGLPGGGLVITRAISAGELVPQSAVGDPIGTRLAPLVLSVSGQLAKSVAAGSVVDLWSARENDNVFGPPVVLVSSATVVRVIAKQGILADRAGESVEVLVPRAKTAKVLEAIANEDAISVVPVDIPTGG
ncbi:MAG: rane protein [Microbacteriaceae bacterium]|nr:rane protein [Microbacteriaceae bacterium]